MNGFGLHSIHWMPTKTAPIATPRRDPEQPRRRLPCFTLRSPHQTTTLLASSRSGVGKRQLEIRQAAGRPVLMRLDRQVVEAEQQIREERRLGHDHEDHAPPAVRPAGRPGRPAADGRGRVPVAAQRQTWAGLPARCASRRLRPHPDGRWWRCSRRAPTPISHHDGAAGRRRGRHARSSAASGACESSGILRMTSGSPSSAEVPIVSLPWSSTAPRGPASGPRIPAGGPPRAGDASPRRGSRRSCRAAAARRPTIRASARPRDCRPPRRRVCG